MSKSTIWSKEEEKQMLADMLNGIQKGIKIKQLLEIQVALTGRTLNSIKSKWKDFNRDHSDFIFIAKMNWKMWGKPAKDEELRIQKEIAKYNAKVVAENKKTRLMMVKSKPRKERLVVKVETNKAPNPKDKGLLIRTDASGVAELVK